MKYRSILILFSVLSSCTGQRKVSSLFAGKLIVYSSFPEDRLENFDFNYLYVIRTGDSLAWVNKPLGYMDFREVTEGKTVDSGLVVRTRREPVPVAAELPYSTSLSGKNIFIHYYEKNHPVQHLQYSLNRNDTTTVVNTSILCSRGLVWKGRAWYTGRDTTFVMYNTKLHCRIFEEVYDQGSSMAPLITRTVYLEKFTCIPVRID